MADDPDRRPGIGRVLTGTRPGLERVMLGSVPALVAGTAAYFAIAPWAGVAAAALAFVVSWFLSKGITDDGAR